ncbi:GtrA family protein [Candidatus Saccharibacteria bacterium oral taxon 955]|nr:GtrA family protein [Candidatus Saccharibacteria bacterium oral taxon 955]QJU06266.1 GtrA family protein [Candidatus Saccharibacteria bacterium oral taxon 955]
MKNKSQLIRFGLIGVINTALDFGLLFILKLIGLMATTANIFSTSIAFVFSFFANKKYTFRSSGTNIVREMILFVAVTLFGLWVLQTGVIWLVLPHLSKLLRSSEMGLLVTKLIATAVSMTWNYILYDKLVFKKS